MILTTHAMTRIVPTSDLGGDQKNARTSKTKSNQRNEINIPKIQISQINEEIDEEVEAFSTSFRRRPSVPFDFQSVNVSARKLGTQK